MQQPLTDKLGGNSVFPMGRLVSSTWLRLHKNYLVVLLPAVGVTGGVIFIDSVEVVVSLVILPSLACVVVVSVEFVVSPVILPSLLCVVVVSVVFSFVPFWLSQPMVNTPSAAIATNVRKRFISAPFQKKVGIASSPAGAIPAGSSRKIRALSVPMLPVPRLCLGNLSLPHAPKIFHVYRSSAHSFSQPHPVRSHGECAP